MADDIEAILAVTNRDVDEAIHVVADGGEELDIGPGDVYEILPGHDAWVLGDDTFQALEFMSKTAESFAKK